LIFVGAPLTVGRGGKVKGAWGARDFVGARRLVGLTVAPRVLGRAVLPRFVGLAVTLSCLTGARVNGLTVLPNTPRRPVHCEFWSQPCLIV